ncbi:hypothetical protein FQN54_006269 [Arachnomyces sp. PD_36]|nr:hypothetical protein FQN54_006269 [Arachnomyces sp. PD_36]
MEDEELPTVRVFYPYNPHTKTGIECDTDSWAPSSGPAEIFTFAIEEKHPIVARWSDVSKEIARKLDAVGLRWCAIECLQRRQLEKPSETHDDSSVVITVDELPPITDEITEVARSIHELSGNLFVEFIEGGVLRGSASRSEAGQVDRVPQAGKLEAASRTRLGIRDLPDKPHEVDQNPPYDRQPDMGGSIGVSGDDCSTGSFGGYVELYNEEGVMIPCGITCHHVLRPCKLDGNSGTAPIQPIGQSMSREPIQICHPSQADHEYTVSKYDKRIEESSTGLNRLRSQETTDKNTESIQFLEKAIPETEREMEKLTSASRDIGTVYATSGHRIHDKTGCLLDWGLIELKPECIGVNTSKLRTQNKKRYVPVIKDRWPWSFETILDRAIPRFYQIGRSSAREGIINPVKSRVCLRDGPHKTETEELVMVPSEHRSKPSQYGDSGALVVSEMGEVVGLLWGLRFDKETAWFGGEVSYLTPIGPIIEDIREITGYRVRIGETVKGLSVEKRTEFSLPSLSREQLRQLKAKADSSNS